MKRISIALSAAWVGMLLLSGCGDGDSAGRVTLLNVSYDPTRELYREVNESFAKDWQERTQERVTIKQSPSIHFRSASFGRSHSPASSSPGMTSVSCPSGSHAAKNRVL